MKLTQQIIVLACLMLTEENYTRALKLSEQVKSLEELSLSMEESTRHQVRKVNFDIMKWWNFLMDNFKVIKEMIENYEEKLSKRKSSAAQKAMAKMRAKVAKMKAKKAEDKAEGVKEDVPEPPPELGTNPSLA